MASLTQRSMVARTARALLASGLLALAVPAGAQTVTRDEGEFRLLERGREVGTETFTIRQNGTGDNAVIIASARVTPSSGPGMESRVQVAGSSLRPAAYDIVAESRSDPTIHGQVVGRRVTATIRSSAGENVREYLVSEGAVLAEPAVAHHHWFVAQRALAGATRVPLMIPSESRQVFAALTVDPAQALTLGGERIEARRIVVRPEGGAVRFVWVDGEGRVIRLELPDLQLVAERTALPR